MTRGARIMQKLRPRGIYVPVTQAQVLIELAGWQVLDDCPAGFDGKASDECLLLPPQAESVAA